MIDDIHSGWYPAAMQAARPHHSHRSHDGTASAVAASTSRDVAASLSITTKEGDTFSISASFDTTATYASVRGGGEKASAWDISSSSQVSMQVEGNLNEQELQDISRIVKTFLHDLRAMLRGRDVSVANVANGDPQTLASVSATAETHTTVTAIAASLTPAPPLAGGAPSQSMASGPRPQALLGEDYFLRHRGILDGVPRGAALPLPASSPFTPAEAPPAA